MCVGISRGFTINATLPFHYYFKSKPFTTRSEERRVGKEEGYTWVLETWLVRWRRVEYVRVWLWCGLFFQAEDGIRDGHVTGVQTCALPILFLYDRFVFMMRGYAPIKCFCLQDVCRDIAWFYNQCNTTFPLLF